MNREWRIRLFWRAGPEHPWRPQGTHYYQTEEAYRKGVQTHGEGECNCGRHLRVHDVRTVGEWEVIS